MSAIVNPALSRIQAIPIFRATLSPSLCRASPPQQRCMSLRPSWMQGLATCPAPCACWTPHLSRVVYCWLHGTMALLKWLITWPTCYRRLRWYSIAKVLYYNLVSPRRMFEEIVFEDDTQCSCLSACSLKCFLPSKCYQRCGKKVVIRLPGTVPLFLSCCSSETKVYIFSHLSAVPHKMAGALFLLPAWVVINLFSKSFSSCLLFLHHRRQLKGKTNK